MKQTITANVKQDFVLNDCPFCFVKGKLYIGNDLESFYVGCGCCFCRGPMAQTESKAIEKWNGGKDHG